MSPIARFAEARLKGPEEQVKWPLPPHVIFVGTFDDGVDYQCDFYWDREGESIYDSWGVRYFFSNQYYYPKQSAKYRCMTFIKKLEQCLHSQDLPKLD